MLNKTFASTGDKPISKIVKYILYIINHYALLQKTCTACGLHNHSAELLYIKFFWSVYWK